jgi:hypothetical protein
MREHVLAGLIKVDGCVFSGVFGGEFGGVFGGVFHRQGIIR